MKKHQYKGLVHEALFNGNGIARRLIIALVLFSSIITAIIATIELYGEYQSDVEAINNSFSFIEQSSVPVLTESVWVSDFLQITSQIQGLLNLRDMEYVAISVNGVERWSSGQQISRRVETRRIPLSRQYRGEKVVIGELLLVASLDNVWERLWNHMALVLVENGIKTLLVALFMLLVVQLMVTRHLSRLSQYARTFDLKELDAEDLHLDRAAKGRWRPDALDYLVNSVNDMRHNLRATYLEMQDTHQRLEQSEERLRLALEATNDGVWDWSVASGRVDYSPGWVKLLGFESEELAPEYSSWESRIHPGDRDLVLENLKAHMEGQVENIFVEHRLKTKQGKWLWALGRGRVIERNPDGSPARVVGTVSNISTLKEAETQLRRLNEELEHRVHLRTVELEEARDEAEQASQAKSDFLSRMSHELRTPLNAILGFTQLLDIDRDPPLSVEQSDFVHEILFAGKHLLDLINDILDIARIESGHLNLEPEAVNLESLSAECISLLNPLAEKNNIEFVMEINSASVAYVDRLRLRQVIINLLSNAIKYNKPGGKVTLSIKPTEKRQIYISVTDTGYGIEDDDLPKLFQPFERLKNHRADIEGSGIGLALSKRLVEGMNGCIGVESNFGQGSTFWITIPAFKAKKVMPEING